MYFTIIECNYWEAGSGFTHSEVISASDCDGDISEIVVNAKNFCEEWTGGDAAEFTVKIYSGTKSDFEQEYSEPVYTEIFRMDM